MKTISFKVTEKEREIIKQIAERAVKFAKKYKIKWSFEDFKMDVTATHANGCKLDLNKLSEADDFNFCHDIFGIRSHLDRCTGKLTRCFRPRCAR